MIEGLHLVASTDTVNRAEALMEHLSISNMSELFERAVQELEWQTKYANPVRAALLASRAIGKAADSSSNSLGNNSRTGDQPANQ